MITADLQAALYAGLPELFEFDPERVPNGALCLVTPFMYRDGTMAQIFIEERDGRCVLTDWGETLGWLWQCTGVDPSARQLDWIDDICRHELDMPGYRGELMLSCDSPNDFAAAAFRLGQAMLRVSDLWFLEDAAGPGVVVGIEDGATGTATTTAAAKERVG